MKLRVLVLGAGFGGLELSTILSEQLGDRLDLTLIDRNESFYFGFSKLDVMFGRRAPDSVKISYRNIVKTGVTFRQETVTSIDAEARRVTTNAGSYEADVLVLALGADYAPDQTPGLVEDGHEFYTFEGATRLRDIISTFSKGHAVVGVTSTPFKCPPAPSECALLLHDHLTERGVREACQISIVMPYGLPIPPSPDTSRALLRSFKERGIEYIPDQVVKALDPARHIAILGDTREIPYDLFLGIPKHRVPTVVEESGLTVDGWVPVDRKTLRTRYPNVFAIGDVTSVGTAKAGVFAESAARVVAAEILADLERGSQPEVYRGNGLCFIEFGQGLVGRVDVDFLSGPEPTGTFDAPSLEITGEKELFGTTRQARWFGL
jgi:sulfide:quinone oxidoreductase